MSRADSQVTLCLRPDPESPPPSMEPMEAAIVEVKALTESGGVKLTLSSQSNTGYLGVSKKSNTRYSARPFQAQGPGKGQHIGNFATAVEAAVAYAKFVAGTWPASHWRHTRRVRLRLRGTPGFTGRPNAGTEDAADDDDVLLLPTPKWPETWARSKSIEKQATRRVRLRLAGQEETRRSCKWVRMRLAGVEDEA